MKIKDALFSASVAYIVTTLPIWNTGAVLWVIWLMAMLLCWDLLIRIEDWQKKKSARGAATPGRAHKKLISSKL